MAKLENNEADSTQALSTSLNAKIAHLEALRDALKKHDDLTIYQLIDAKRYNQVIKPEQPLDDQYDVSGLVLDIQAELSHYLSDRLIDYLVKQYPFFYYNEYEFGRFRVYFGNWWDHKLFAELDVLHLRFDFDQAELDQLKRSFELEVENKTYYSDQILAITKESEDLQRLIDAQPTRDAKKTELREALRDNESRGAMPWEAAKLKEAHAQLVDQYKQVVAEDEQANNGSEQIKQNEARILDLNKEDTIIGYEKQSIRDAFQTYGHFMEAQKHLYSAYLASLDREVKTNEG